MATIKVFEGETVVKEIVTDLPADEVQARLEAQPYTFNLNVDGQPVSLEVLVHPSIRGTIDSMLAKARKDNNDDVGEEADEDDERFRRLLELLEEEDEDEEEEVEEVEEEKEKAASTIKELVKAVKGLQRTVARLEAKVESQGEVKKEGTKVPVVIKSWAPYERVHRFEQQPQTEMRQEVKEEGLSDFQKALMARLKLLP